MPTMYIAWVNEEAPWVIVPFSLKASVPPERWRPSRCDEIEGEAWSSPRWCMSRKNYRFVRDTRSCTAFGAAVRPVRASDGAFPRHHQARGNAQGAVSKAHRAGSGGVHNCQSRRRRAHTDDRDESWLPSGPRPEGRWCSTELSRGRGRLPEVAHHHDRPAMHVHCMPRLTLDESA